MKECKSFPTILLPLLQDVIVAIQTRMKEPFIGSIKKTFSLLGPLLAILPILLALLIYKTPSFHRPMAFLLLTWHTTLLSVVLCGFITLCVQERSLRCRLLINCIGLAFFSVTEPLAHQNMAFLLLALFSISLIFSTLAFLLTQSPTQLLSAFKRTLWGCLTGASAGGIVFFQAWRNIFLLIFPCWGVFLCLLCLTLSNCFCCIWLVLYAVRSSISTRDRWAMVTATSLTLFPWFFLALLPGILWPTFAAQNESLSMSLAWIFPLTLSHRFIAVRFWTLEDRVRPWYRVLIWLSMVLIFLTILQGTVSPLIQNMTSAAIILTSSLASTTFMWWISSQSVDLLFPHMNRSAFPLHWVNLYPLDLHQLLDRMAKYLLQDAASKVVFLLREETLFFQAYPFQGSPLHWQQLEMLLETLPVAVEHPLIQMMSQQSRPVWFREYARMRISPETRLGPFLPPWKDENDILMFPIRYVNALTGVLFVEMKTPVTKLERLLADILALLRDISVPLQQKRIAFIQQQRQILVHDLARFVPRDHLAQPTEILSSYCRELSDRFAIICSGWIRSPFDDTFQLVFAHPSHWPEHWPARISIHDGIFPIWHNADHADHLPSGWSPFITHSFAWIPLPGYEESPMGHGAFFALFPSSHTWSPDEISLWLALAQVCGNLMDNAWHIQRQAGQLQEQIQRTLLMIQEDKKRAQPESQ